MPINVLGYLFLTNMRFNAPEVAGMRIIFGRLSARIASWGGTCGVIPVTSVTVVPNFAGWALPNAIPISSCAT